MKNIYFNKQQQQQNKNSSVINKVLLKEPQNFECCMSKLFSFLVSPKVHLESMEKRLWLCCRHLSLLNWPQYTHLVVLFCDLPSPNLRLCLLITSQLHFLCWKCHVTCWSLCALQPLLRASVINKSYPKKFHKSKFTLIRSKNWWILKMNEFWLKRKEFKHYNSLSVKG